MNNLSVPPKAGQVWTHDKNHTEIEIIEINSRGIVIWKSVDETLRGTTFLNMFNALFTFKPANDLEWLAVNMSTSFVKVGQCYGVLNGIIVGSMNKSEGYYFGAEIIAKCADLYSLKGE